MTFLRKLCIAGYRSISADVPCEIDFDGVTLLIGANGSGKSNILSVLRMLQNGLGDGMLAELEKSDAQAQFHLGPRHTDRATFAAGFPESTVEWSIGFVAPNGVSMTKRTGSESEAEIPSVGVYNFADTSIFSGIRRPAYQGNDGVLMSDARNLAPFLRRMEKHFPGYFRRFERHVSSVVPDFGGFRLSDDSVTHNVTLDWTGADRSGYIYGPHQLSDGSLRYIALSALLLAPPEMSPDLIAIDEPETGLHPAAQESLAAMAAHASTHSQILMATQSPLLVDCFPADGTRVVERDGAGGSTVCRTLSSGALKDWLEEYSLSDLWRKNIIGGNP